MVVLSGRATRKGKKIIGQTTRRFGRKSQERVGNGFVTLLIGDTLGVGGVLVVDMWL